MHLLDPTIPDEVRVLNVDGILYYVHWEALTPGASFFIPTVATDRMVAKALHKAVKYFGHDFKVVSRCEHGVYGARIWRNH